MCKIIIKYVCINIIKTLISYLVFKFKCGCVLTKSLGREGGREGEREREREREIGTWCEIKTFSFLFLSKLFVLMIIQEFVLYT